LMLDIRSIRWIDFRRCSILPSTLIHYAVVDGEGRLKWSAR
jgi:hypothetical protein